MAEWQPIETAPRDGTPMMLYLCRPAEQLVHEGIVFSQIVLGDMTGAGNSVESITGEVLEATHWQPMPEPPS